MRLTPRVAGFRLEYPAGFELECMAGFIGTRTLIGCGWLCGLFALGGWLL
jgi:hypothetical protein